jgi:hypothetical protein
VSRLNAALVAALADATVRARFTELSQDVFRAISRRWRRTRRCKRPTAKNGGRSSRRPTSRANSANRMRPDGQFLAVGSGSTRNGPIAITRQL